MAPSTRGFLPFGIILLLVLAVFINYVDRGNLATAAPLIQNELHLTNAQIGLLLSAFFWSYAPAQLLSGWAAHRFDVRYTLAAGLTLWSVATMLTGLTSGFVLLFAFRLVLGLGESTLYPCNARLLAERAPEEQRGTANGLVAAGQALGPALGTLGGGLLMARFGWRAVFVVLGVLSLWLPLYLVKARGFSMVEMSQVGSLVYAMHALSCSLIGWVSDRWIERGVPSNRVRKTLLVVGSLGVAATLLACARAPLGTAVVLLLISGFFFGFLQPQIFAAAQTLGGRRAAGKWMALQNMLGNFAGVLSPLVTGLVVDRTGSYDLAFALASASAVAAAFVWAYGVRRIEPVEWS
jgi:MFS family permease